MASQDADAIPYELLGVGIESTEAEIKTAYRQRSLKVHPDRHPNNPDAANKFHELNQAYELLLDPIRRTSLDASLRVKMARKERFGKFNVKRKGMQDELEEAERAVKRAKMGKAKEERERKEETERIKEEGRRMREERQEEITRKGAELGGPKETVGGEAVRVGEVGPLDTTVRVKYPLSQHPALTTPSSLSALLSAFGTIDESSIVISMKPSKKASHKPPRYATALIPFRKIGDAFAAVCASGNGGKGLKDVEISWAEGKEPAVLEMLKLQGQVDSEGGGGEPTPSSQPGFVSTPSAATGKGKMPSFASSSPSFSFDPSESRQSADASNTPGLDYESVTLMRLRQAERDRLEREIREQEVAS